MMVGFDAHAKENGWFQHTTIQGFVSQTIISTTDNNFLGSTNDRASFDFWEAGALVNTKVFDKLSFSSQLLGREVSQATGVQTRIDFAFFSYPFIQGIDYTVGARLGRIRSSFGFYNETRDIPHTRTGVIMPQSLYYDMTRNSFYSADGIEFFAHRDIGENRLSFQMFFSKPVEEKEELKEAAGLNPDEFDGDKGFLAKITYGSEFEGFRVGFTYFRPEFDVDVTLKDFPFDTSVLGLPLGEAILTLDGDSSTFYSENMVTSIEYNQINWSLTAEYSRHKFNTDINVNVATIQFPTLVPGEFADLGGSLTPSELKVAQDKTNNILNNDFYEEAFYLQGLYRVNDYWETYLRFEYSQPHSDESIDPLDKWKDINAGVTYRPDERWLLRGEFHYIEGANRLFSRDNPRESRGIYWTAAMLQIAYKW